jgi:hypothetical protein
MDVDAARSRAPLQRIDEQDEVADRIDRENRQRPGRSRLVSDPVDIRPRPWDADTRLVGKAKNDMRPSVSKDLEGLPAEWMVVTDDPDPVRWRK